MTRTVGGKSATAATIAEALSTEELGVAWVAVDNTITLTELGDLKLLLAVCTFEAELMIILTSSW